MYEYKYRKANLFSEDGLNLFTGIRDHVLSVLKVSGA